MLFKPLLGNQLSGSIGGITASHNRGGTYFRNRSTPVQPNSIQQQIVKAVFGALSTRWSQTLTALQRNAWDVYAENTPVLNAIGESITLTGLNMYIRGNTPRVQASLSIVDDGPTTFGLPSVSPVTIDTLVPGSNEYNLNFTPADAWANQDDAFMFSFSSRPKKPTILFFKGPFRLTATILGNSSVPPTSPDTQSATFPFNSGDLLYVRVVVADAEARLSQSQIVSALAA